jgi:exonuclease 3'-5' domain-containing protein 1
MLTKTATQTDISTRFVDTTAAIADLIDQLPSHQPLLCVDLEGTKLSRKGSISIFTLMVHGIESKNHVYLIDVRNLGHSAFSTPGKNGKTLKHVLEAADITKLFFDVRNDSDALHHHFNIALQGVEDVQLMEIGSRTGPKRHLRGLARCIEYDAGLDYRTKGEWKEGKARGELLFSPVKGGSYDVFNARPLAEDIKAYCAGDVQYLPVLRNLYWNRLSHVWKQKVADETRRRVLESQMASYQAFGDHKVLGPWLD